jgi:hypothetical protein
MRWSRLPISRDPTTTPDRSLATDSQEKAKTRNCQVFSFVRTSDPETVGLPKCFPNRLHAFGTPDLRAF